MYSLLLKSQGKEIKNIDISCNGWFLVDGYLIRLKVVNLIMLPRGNFLGGRT